MVIDGRPHRVSRVRRKDRKATGLRDFTLPASGSPRKRAVERRCFRTGASAVAIGLRRAAPSPTRTERLLNGCRGVRTSCCGLHPRAGALRPERHEHEEVKG